MSTEIKEKPIDKAEKLKELQNEKRLNTVVTYTPCPCCETRIEFKTRMPSPLGQLMKWIKCANCLSEYFIQIKRKNQGSLAFEGIDQKITKKGEDILKERTKKPPVEPAQTKGVEDAKPN